MVGLIRAEWLKITRQGTSRIIAALFVAAAALVVFVTVYNASGTGPLKLRQGNYQVLDFPQGIIQGFRIIQNLGVLLVPIFIASIIGAEYGLDTWKILLIRQPGRVRFIAAKIAVGLAGLVLIFAATMLVTQVFSLIGHAVVSDSATKAGLQSATYSGDMFWRDLTSNALSVMPTFGVVAGIAILFAVVGRSTVAGIIPAIVWTIGDGVMPRFLPDLKFLSVSVNSDSLQQNFLSGNGAFSTGQSVAFIAAYMIIPVALALAIFHKRDMAG